VLEVICPESKVLVGVSCVAVGAIELTSTIRIQSPPERKKPNVDAMEYPLASDGDDLDSDHDLSSI